MTVEQVVNAAKSRKARRLLAVARGALLVADGGHRFDPRGPVEAGVRD